MRGVVAVRPKVLIVGSGRSGTSTAARICHEKLGICMGRFFKPADEMNPEGYYEDYVSHGLVRSMVAGVLLPTDYLEIMSEVLEVERSSWSTEQGDRHPRWHTMTVPWGAKDPWFLQLQPSWQKALEPELAIICRREPKLVVESWLRVAALAGRAPSREVIDRYKEITEMRYEACDAVKLIWPNYLELNFDEERTDEWVEEGIRERL